MEPLANAAEAALAQTLRQLRRPGFEEALHQWLRRAIGIDNLIVIAYSDSDRPRVLSRHNDLAAVFAELDTTYLAGAYQLDPFYGLHRARVPAGVYRLRDVAPDAFPRSRYYLEYYRQTTLIDELGFVAWPQPALSISICLGRDAASGQAFGGREVQICQRIAPIVAALAEAHWADLSPPAAQRGESLAEGLALSAERRLGLKLTPRQAEVAILILQGHSTASIGLRLGVSPQTVKVFRRQLHDRCGISSQAELFALMLPLLRG